MKREEILATAQKCVCGDREEDYGSPEDNFGTIAIMEAEGTLFPDLDEAGKLIACVLLILSFADDQRAVSFWEEAKNNG